MNRFNYRELEGMVTLCSEDLDIIEQRAKGLSLEQCLEYLCLTEAELTEAERVYIRRAHKRGVADGITKAVDRLFRHMETKVGGQTALEYLRTRSDSFQVNATPTTKSGFSFNVVMPD